MPSDAAIRQFLEAGIASALDYSLLAEHEVIDEIGIPLIVESLERPIRARLLAACLKAETIDAELLLRTIGVGELCESVPTRALWRALAIAGARASNTSPEMPAAPKARTTAKKREPRAAGTNPAAASPAKLAAKAAQPAVKESSNGAEPRKPNRRASGAGATSRKRRDSSSPGSAMFVSSGRRSSSRAATEPAIPPDSADDIAEIEIVDETEVEVPLK